MNTRIFVSTLVGGEGSRGCRPPGQAIRVWDRGKGCRGTQPPRAAKDGEVLQPSRQATGGPWTPRRVTAGEVAQLPKSVNGV